MLVGKIEKDPVGMFSNAHADRPLGSIKLCARFEQIERRRYDRSIWRGPGGAVVAAPHPVAETFAANRPGFPMTLCYQISECNAAWIMEHLFTEDHLLEHLGQQT